MELILTQKSRVLDLKSGPERFGVQSKSDSYERNKLLLKHPRKCRDSLRLSNRALRERSNFNDGERQFGVRSVKEAQENVHTRGTPAARRIRHSPPGSLGPFSVTAILAIVIFRISIN